MRAVLGNWPIKVTALILAAVLWALVAAEEPTSQLVPVSLVVVPPDGRTLVTALPPVRALYAGSAREIMKLYASPPTIKKVIPNTVIDSEYLLELNPEDLVVNGRVGAQAQDVKPRRIWVKLDEVARRTVPVVPRLRITPDSGYLLSGGIAVVPGNVVVRGPEAQVKQIDEIKTVPLEIVGANGPVRQWVRLDTAGFGTVQVSPNTVQILAEVEAVSERVLTEVPVRVSGPASGWVGDPPTVMVTLRGPLSRLAQLSRDSVVALVWADRLRLGKKAAVEVVAPAGIKGTAIPDSVEVRRTRP